MPGKNPVTFLVRLNLNKTRHRQALELLKQRGSVSYTEAIVEALLHQSDASSQDDLEVKLTKTVRAAISDEMKRFPAFVSVPPSETSSMTDDDYDVAMDFMDSL